MEAEGEAEAVEQEHQETAVSNVEPTDEVESEELKGETEEESEEHESERIEEREDDKLPSYRQKGPKKSKNAGH